MQTGKVGESTDYFFLNILNTNTSLTSNLNTIIVYVLFYSIQYKLANWYDFK